MTLSATIPAPAPAPAYGWVRNGLAQINGSDLQLTQAGAGYAAGSAFYGTALPSSGLQISFSTAMSGGTGGTGFAVVLADPIQARERLPRRNARVVDPERHRPARLGALGVGHPVQRAGAERH